MTVLPCLVDYGCERVYERMPKLTLDISCDAVILHCIMYAVEHGWPPSRELLVHFYTTDLPLCKSNFDNEGAVRPVIGVMYAGYKGVVCFKKVQL